MKSKRTILVQAAEDVCTIMRHRSLTEQESNAITELQRAISNITQPNLVESTGRELLREFKKDLKG